jgi:8-oxo-dGTP diphosphatase
MNENQSSPGPEDQKRDPSIGAIQKVGAAILRENKVLVVRKKTQNKSEYYMAGGRMEENETQRDTLIRELKEELGVDISSMQYLGSYTDSAVFEEEPIIIHAYAVHITGEPAPQSEIKEYIWIDRDFEKKGIKVSSIMAKKVIPQLIARGLL